MGQPPTPLDDRSVDRHRPDDGACRVEVTRPRPGVAVCTVSGSVDLSTHHELAEGLDTAATDTDLLVVELRDVVFMDSKGMYALFRIAGRVEVVKVLIPRNLATGFRISGLHQVMDVVGSR